ncbi:MAG: CotH kinase family protein [Prolixibacteraceae bacterium]|nr:CotH kinase family protein [Prolixibacteraceae bacterium]
MKHLYYFFVLIIFLFEAGFLSGQQLNPPYNEVFRENEITRIEIHIDADEKEALIHPANPEIDHYYECELLIQNSLLDTALYPVGIRIRGNTSRHHQKKSYKIDFKEFGGEQFYKLKKLNLKPNNNDPGQLRELLSWQMYRNMNVPAARTNYIELYMNDEFMGVYLNVENIDDEFVDRRFGNEAGNLYKCSWGATLELSNSVYDNHLFEIKTNEEENNRNLLNDFIQLLNSPDVEGWDEKMEAIFDVDNYLRQLAVESTIGHWDGYSFNMNNFYLYENPETGKIVFIPYDLDNTWGIDWIGYDWTEMDVLDWHSRQYTLPLTENTLAVPRFFNAYIGYLNDCFKWFNVDYIGVIASSYIDLLEESISNDRYYTLDYGYSVDDFVNSFDEAWGRQVVYSIRDYIEKRQQNSLVQISPYVVVSNVVVSESKIYPNPSDGCVVCFDTQSQESKPEVFSTTGRRISFIQAGNKLQFSDPLLPGVYVLKAESGVYRFSVYR